MSERTAWSLAVDRRVNMVSVNAALVLGPDVAVRNAISTLSYLKGLSLSLSLSLYVYSIVLC